jgi:hypothetical protein
LKQTDRLEQHRVNGDDGSYVTRSGLFIRFLILPLLDLDVMFDRFCELDRLKHWCTHRSDELRSLILLTGGHARSLRFLLNILPPNNETVFAVVVSMLNDCARDIFTAGARDDAPSVVLDLLALSVLSQTTASRFGGAALNTPKMDADVIDPFVPRLSLMYLSYWAEHYGRSDSKDLKVVADMVKALLEVAVENEGLEYFYAHFVKLRRWAHHSFHGPNRTTTLAN